MTLVRLRDRAYGISGAFTASAVQRPWRDVGRSRIARFLYLYAISLLIHTAILAAASGFPLTGLVIGVSLAVHRGPTALGARWLFGLPGRCRSEPTR